MKDTLGLMLREAWKEKGRSDCHHPDLHKEYSFSGSVTGCYICATCGQLMRMEQVQSEVDAWHKSLSLGNGPQRGGQAAGRSQGDRWTYESNEGGYMKARYSERIAANVPVSITMGSLVWKGRILDLSIVGCLIESTVSVKKGDSLQLRLSLPGLESSFSVALAAVRWSNGSQFGVEFIKMNEKDQRQLNQVMARHLSNRALPQEGKRHQFTEPGEPLVPRHLLARRGKSGGCVPLPQVGSNTKSPGSVVSKIHRSATFRFV